MAWLLPPVLFTFTMFIFIWLGGLLIWSGTLFFPRFSHRLFDDENLNNAFFITSISISTLWFSYLLFSKKIFHKTRPLETPSEGRKLLKQRANFLVFFCVSLYLYGVSSGFVGYAKDEDSVGSFSNFISLFQRGAFLVLLLYYAHNFVRLNKQVDRYLVILIGSLALLGVLAGSKYQIALPFIYIILIHYYMTGIIFSKKLVIGGLIFLSSFIIIGPVREMLRESKANISYNSALSNETQLSSVSSAAMDMLYRVTYIPPLVLAVNYHGHLPPAVSNLWEYVITSPVNAFIPRFINPNKPEVTFGRWFSLNVYGSTEDNNIGATFQGILYLAGGVWSVIFGFLLIGCVQAIFVRYLFIPKYVPIYLILLPKLVLLPQEPWMLFVGLLQSFITIYLIYILITSKR
ncbi:O-antigen polymerase [Parapedobacter composti]|nr:O-antigen polymerase [Parapedobacter composti]